MRFLTNEEFPFKAHSEHFSALLALHHLEPTRPYEKLFPSPFKEAWLVLSGQAPQPLRQQQQEGADSPAAGSKKTSARSKATKAAATGPTAAEEPADVAISSTCGIVPMPVAAPTAAATGPKAVKQRQSGAGDDPRIAPPTSAAVNVNSPLLSDSPSKGASEVPVAVQISSAHRYASEFERQQAAEVNRLKQVKKEKEREIQRLEEEAQMPTVYMAEAVRKKVSMVLKEVLPHVTAQHPAVAAAALAGKNAESLLFPLQWTDSKWISSVSWALRRQMNAPRAMGALRTRLLKELTGHLQFEKEISSAAVEAVLAVLVVSPQQRQQPQEQVVQQTETVAFLQVVESCQDFIAINTADEGSLPSHFSPAGKQIEIRCQGASPQQRQQQHREDERGEKALQASKERFFGSLKALCDGAREKALLDTLLQLAGALSSLCCCTGLYAIAARTLDAQQQEQGEPVAAFADAFAAVAAAAGAVVGTPEVAQTRALVQRLGGSALTAEADFLNRTEAVIILESRPFKPQLEASESLLPDSVSLRLRVPIQGDASKQEISEDWLGAPTGFHLRVPIDPPAASSIESCLKASLGSDYLQEGFQGISVLNIFSPPGAAYPLEPPIVWISSEVPCGSPSEEVVSLSEITHPPYAEIVGAIICGTFGAHNALRLSRPLQQLSEKASLQGCPIGSSPRPPCPSRILNVLSSSICETSISDVAALLQAPWQFEAQLDELLAKEPDGPRGMVARWVTVATGAPILAAGEAATGQELALSQQSQQCQGSTSPLSYAGDDGVPPLPPKSVRDKGEVRRTSNPPRGPHTQSHAMEGLTTGEIQVCKTILKGAEHPASRDAMSLPVRQHFDTVLEFMGNPFKRVLVVQGETGSGKTTQLPRMLLEAAAQIALQQLQSNSSISKDQFPGFVVCTQPRRLAAVSVASRAASEMGSPLGALVGYQVRLESRLSQQTRLLFCTHGVLLRQILSGDVLERASVVVVDEVHERCTEVDMLLLVLAKALANKSHNLKVVVMSASLAVEHFVAYFRPERLVALRAPSGCRRWQDQRHMWQQQQQLLRDEGEHLHNSVAILRVPGRTFPVSVYYLSEVLEMCERPSLPSAYQGASAAAAASAVEARYRGGAKPAAAKTEWRDVHQDTFFSNHSSPGNQTTPVAATAAGTPVGSLPQLPQLVAAVVRHVHLTGIPCGKSASGAPRGHRVGKLRQQEQQQGAGTAIIVFCSGVGEVSAVCRAIEELQLDLWVLPCHASLHPRQQQKVFAAPPAGWRKVVVATNIAETSITISDVGYVVDCGTHKMLRYDPSRRSSKLQEELITKANAQQRSGRAGRVAEGHCFRLYEKGEFNDMPQAETPELHRQALHNVCLQLKAIFPEEPLHHLLGQCLDPPAQDHVDASIRHLVHLGALECNGGLVGESLTPLGLFLSRFPMSISYAKMLIFAAPLGCLEETLALCALMAADSDLYIPGAEAAAERQKHFARSQSDFVSNLRVFAAWKAAVACGRGAEDEFCMRFGVNSSTCRAAEALRKRFRRVARDAGLMAMMGREPERQILSSSTGMRQGAPSTSAISLNYSSNNNSVEGCDSDTGDDEVALHVEETSSPVSVSDIGSTEGTLGVVSSQSPKGRARDSVRSIYWYIKACVVAGLYPQVATIQAPRIYTAVGSGTLEKAPEAWQMKFFTRVDADPISSQEDKRNSKQKLQRVFIHPTSINFKTCEYDTQWVAFGEKLQTTKLFIKDVSTVSVFALLLLSCCELVPAQGEGALWLDGWLQLRCPGLISSYVKHLKGLFHTFLNEFYCLSAVALIRRGSFDTQGAPLPQARNLDYDQLALEIPVTATNPRCVFFGASDAIHRRCELTALIKRLVELEGHLV
ncbi:uncharacterized protein LOC34618749 [Cyclospora cayetanensis]|uniref:Uncharacterized protein LOC34618749 n=1 Tax=Cyclospora cayetanensis TaxID=88456 RepID=A0A6P6RX35_9EIME|nr:uncharacterized protein LOC34618749 [Cyclospora cayetanensis]